MSGDGKVIFKSDIITESIPLHTINGKGKLEKVGNTEIQYQKVARSFTINGGLNADGTPNYEVMQLETSKFINNRFEKWNDEDQKKIEIINEKFKEKFGDDNLILYVGKLRDQKKIYELAVWCRYMCRCVKLPKVNKEKIKVFCEESELATFFGKFIFDKIDTIFKNGGINFEKISIEILDMENKNSPCDYCHMKYCGMYKNEKNNYCSRKCLKRLKQKQLKNTKKNVEKNISEQSKNSDK